MLPRAHARSRRVRPHRGGALLYHNVLRVRIGAPARGRGVPSVQAHVRPGQVGAARAADHAAPRVQSLHGTFTLSRVLERIARPTPE